MQGGKTKSRKVEGVEELNGCLFAVIQNQGVGTANIFINDAGTALKIEPSNNIIIYQGLVPTDIKLNVKTESEDNEIILVFTEIIC